MSLAELLDALEYKQFPQYYYRTDEEHNPVIAPLLRFAKEAGVDGIYVFQSRTKINDVLSVQPAVYVAQAQSVDQARNIHRTLWNYGNAPFLIVILPNQIRVYTGFDYSRESPNTGLLIESTKIDKDSIITQFADFCAHSINTGNIWQRTADALHLDRRVDRRLLKNLSDLGEYLREKMKVESEVAHALIGKYVYICYLRDGHILSDEWLQLHHIDIAKALSRQATVVGLRNLVEVLDDQFNGNIFPLNFANAGLTDEVVSLVASVFEGDQILPGDLRQLSFDFNIYDFAYIPVEMLSSIYEQFLHIEGKGKHIGAFYTPEYLADYLLAEMNTVKPLKKGIKILDPSCGSGIFLVLAYRQLIELELRGSTNKKLSLAKLSELLSFLYGIERELDACYVAEFSLILTMLHYIDPSELLVRERLLPSLHNTHIFQDDFFNESSPLWQKNLKFDWIVGNPPWIKNADEQKDQFALSWMQAHREEQPVSNENIAEAFSWRVLNLLDDHGYVGLILPAASLYNFSSTKYRQRFFQSCEVLRMTNFSNLRHVLFGGRASAAAITILYHKAFFEQKKPYIAHYGPFALNQIPNAHGGLWTITMNENEFQTISADEAESGDPMTWKVALWGTERDKRAMARLRRLFPTTLGQLCQDGETGWHLHEGSQLRLCIDEQCKDFEFVPQIIGKKILDTNVLDKSGRRFSLPEHTFKTLEKNACFVRIRGGRRGLLTSEPPHIIMNASWKYVIYSDEYFVIKPRQIGLSAPQSHADYLRALSVYLSSSVVSYYLFFKTPSWGIERDRITLQDVKSIPIPHFTTAQVEQLAAVQKQLAQIEIAQGALYTQNFLDEQIASALKLPHSINILAMEFNRVRSKLVGGAMYNATAKKDDLLAYAQELREELDNFTSPSTTRHRVTISDAEELICCTVELINADSPVSAAVENMAADPDHFVQLRYALEKDSNFSQWAYIQRGLRVFDGLKMYLYKHPLLINWTRTQALNDADDLISEILTAGMMNDE